ncbi:hypothetical protein CANCADRAFT_4412 [Tortispora caseinolytica NRRL Y-17796]|uniref:DASH complex subunit DAD2 n=1 Tax=Tortispora caseinolytica NRRL Y-17796 TaxID=767744 RepID=A0A1E4TDE2_9ASCO|nr:hypothetical protein CANCADRAFT_4412 [Tortispora caseinolytica NRRL Y-17796]
MRSSYSHTPPGKERLSRSSKIQAKRDELAQLQQLKVLSAAYADRLQDLHKEMESLQDDAKAVALVAQNWDFIMKAVNIGSHPREDLNLPAELMRIPVSQKNKEDAS